MPKFFVGLLVMWTLGCGSDKGRNNSAQCDEEKASIQADVEKLNFCAVAEDCQATWVNPHWGCYIESNKGADTTAVKARIDDYSDSECWDGRTTLRLLDCALPRTPACVAGKCEL